MAKSSSYIVTTQMYDVPTNKEIDICIESAALAITLTSASTLIFFAWCWNAPGCFLKKPTLSSSFSGLQILILGWCWSQRCSSNIYPQHEEKAMLRDAWNHQALLKYKAAVLCAVLIFLETSKQPLNFSLLSTSPGYFVLSRVFILIPQVCPHRQDAMYCNICNMHKYLTSCPARMVDTSRKIQPQCLCQ